MVFPCVSAQVCGEFNPRCEAPGDLSKATPSGFGWTSLASPSCGRLAVSCLPLRPFPLGGLIAPPSFPWRGAGGRAGGHLPQPQLPPALLFNLRPNRAVGESGKQNVGDQQTSKPATLSKSFCFMRFALFLFLQVEDQYIAPKALLLIFYNDIF